MKVTVLMLAAVCILAIEIPVQTSANDRERECAAIVTRVKGRCTCRNDTGAKKALSVGDCLLGAQKVRCHKYASAQIRFCVNNQRVTLGPNFDYVIPNVSRRIVPVTCPDGRGGGSTMGGDASESKKPWGTKPHKP